ncbi:BRCA1-A complex subunit Abraxas 1-like isoform X1 [Montipora foliosa]|uniref:BRCA1-A complex subunit Abraxas 1-like isoform X1 n=1 Tax=Montipora foliosa TaxID=591990 RepID=UPI0035F134BD
MEVCLSGCVFSSLVYELENSPRDVEGLLMGQITSRIVNTITDSQSENLRHERVATIQGFIPLDKLQRFYTGIGEIVDDVISEEINNDNEKTEKVIGWFKFRRNTQGLVSMRERFIHHNLIKKLNFTPPKEFILAVFTACMSRDLSTHKFDYSFCCSADREGIFEPIQVRILNLGDTSHSEYRCNSLAAQATSSLFYEVIDSYRNDFVDDKGCMTQSSNMHGMYITMMKKLQELVEVVKISETTVSSLTEEVEMRRREVESCRQQLSSRNEKLSEVAEERSPQPNLASSKSNQDIDKDLIDLSEQDAGINIDDDKIKQPHFSENNLEERNDQYSWSEKEKSDVNEKVLGKAAHSSRRRKQRTPTRVASYSAVNDNDDDDDDDDITDDETQSYSNSDSMKRNELSYEETFSQNLAMESSSPIF